MIDYEEAVRIILKNTHVGPPEDRPVAACGGYVLAEDARALVSFPPSPVSTRDGFAVRSEDLSGAISTRPVTLPVIETVRAGRIAKKAVRAGTCARIMTGAALPEGADAVVRFEDTDEQGGKNAPGSGKRKAVKIYVSPAPGTYIHAAGSAVVKGTLVLPAGTVMGPPQIAGLISAGRDRARVIRRPRVAIIATGDELTRPGELLKPGRIYNSNGASMAAMVAHYGGVPRVLGIARDREASLLGKLKNGLHSDAVITTGGVSMGDYDVVRMLLGTKSKVLFSKIKMGPGASVVFSLMERPRGKEEAVMVPVFGLAGPPGGSIINFETLVRPALLKMRGLTNFAHPEVEAVAEDALAERKSLAFMKWAVLTGKPGAYRVTLNATTDKGGAFSAARSNALAIIPENTEIRPGDKLKVLTLDWTTGH